MIRNLAYLGFTSPAAEEWKSFGPDILGLAVASDGPGGSIRLRVDDRAWRIAVHPGDDDRLAYLGWDMGDAHNLQATIERVVAEGLEVRSDPELASGRETDTAAWFVDSFGIRHELVVGLHDGGDFEPGRALHGSFLTGDLGLGHVALVVPDLEEGHRFFADVLGLVISDYIDAGVSLRFYHCAGRAARHHTLALMAAPGTVSLGHLMLELTDIDDVGQALDLVKEAGLPLARDFGRHPNDRMSSFYVRSPSGFDVEYGTGGVVIDDDTWQTATYDKISVWGHLRPANGPLVPPELRPLDQTGAPS